MSAVPDTLYFRVLGNDSPELPKEQTLPDGWRLDRISSRKERHSFYDTFENQAYNKGLLVVRKKGKIELDSFETGKALADVPLSGTPYSFFPSELDDGKAKEMLLDCSNIRAFIKSCSIDVLISSWRVLDNNQKTVAILNAESLHLVEVQQPDVFARYFSVTPLKGYHRELAHILKALPEPVDTYRITGFRERYLQIVEAAGHHIGGYCSKFRQQLDPEATIHENIRRLLQFTTSVMLANEQGIRKNIDTEFLHDYRVAVRRARSVLRQIRGVFDPQQTAWALSGLREIGKRTNQLRDNDVYLLQKETYQSLQHPLLRTALGHFFIELEAERRTLHRQLCAYLSSPEYRQFMNDWEAFITRKELPDQELAPNSALSTRTVGVKAIRKAWKKVIVHGRRVSPHADDKELHELRIDCKRLRYLLEFFSSLFPDKTAGRLIGHLKELQEILGDFVDVSVQIDFLYGRLESISATDGISQAAAVGGLIIALYRQQEEARSLFGKAFDRFDDPKTNELFDELLTSLQ